MLAAHVGTLAPRVRKGQRGWYEKLAPQLLPRVNRSNRVVSRCMAALERARRGPAELRTDEKPSYRMLLRRMDPSGSIAHRTTSSKVPRRTWNPLFTVNQTLAMVRDGLSRMVRRTWAGTKKRRRLWLHLGIYFVWKNFVRTRRNQDRRSAAQYAKVTGRRWRPSDLVRWRLDLGKVSLSPWSREPLARA